MSGFTDTLDEAALAAPLAGDAAGGAWLRHDPVYDEIKAAREQEPGYLPQGIWARDLKQADWATVVRLTGEALRTRSKDLQLAAWLAEGLTHLDGLPGLTAGLRVLTELCRNVWDGLYPPIDEDDGVEPRILVLEWCDRHLPKALQAVNLTRPSTPLAESISVLAWDEAERREKQRESEDHNSRRSRRREAEAAEPEELTRDAVNTSIRLTPRAVYTEVLDAAEQARAQAGELCRVVDEQCGEHQARLPKLEAMLGHVRDRAREAMDLLDSEAAARAEDDAGQGAPDAAAAAGHGEWRGDTGARSAATAPARPADPVEVVGAIREREAAYRALSALGERLAELDPHSPAPYLVRRAAALKDQTFADLVMLLADDDRQRQHLFRLLGISDDDRTQEGVSHAGG